MGADDRRGAPAIGLIGTFDIANYGDLLLPEVTERELVARIPDLVVRRLAPFGWEHPVPSDGGVVAEPLGEPTDARRAELAEDCDALIIGGGEIIHFEDRLLAPHYDTTEEEVLARAPSTWFVDGTGPAAWVDLHYARFVVGGPGAFVLEARSFESFAETLLRKLLKEIRGGRGLVDGGGPVTTAGPAFPPARRTPGGYGGWCAPRGG